MNAIVRVRCWVDVDITVDEAEDGRFSGRDRAERIGENTAERFRRYLENRPSKQVSIPEEDSCVTTGAVIREPDEDVVQPDRLFTHPWFAGAGHRSKQQTQILKQRLDHALMLINGLQQIHGDEPGVTEDNLLVEIIAEDLYTALTGAEILHTRTATEPEDFSRVTRSQTYRRRSRVKDKEWVHHDSETIGCNHMESARKWMKREGWELCGRLRVRNRGRKDRE